MKATVFFAALLAIFWLMTPSVVSSQTRQENRQIADIENEISRLQNQANRLENSLADTTYLAAMEAKVTTEIAKLVADTVNPVDIPSLLTATKQIDAKNVILGQIRHERFLARKQNREIQNQLNGLYARIAQLETSRKAIFDRYTTTTDIPREMTQNTMKRRLQSNVVRREESSINVLEHLPVYGNMVDSTVLLKVVVDNKAIGAVSFQFKPLNGGLAQPIAVPAKTKMEIFLVPGDYLVIAEYRSSLKTTIITVDRVVANYEGIPCHGYTFYPAY